MLCLMVLWKVCLLQYDISILLCVWHTRMLCHTTLCLTDMEVSRRPNMQPFICTLSLDVSFSSTWSQGRHFARRSLKPTTCLWTDPIVRYGRVFFGEIKSKCTVGTVEISCIFMPPPPTTSGRGIMFCGCASVVRLLSICLAIVR